MPMWSAKMSRRAGCAIALALAAMLIASGAARAASARIAGQRAAEDEQAAALMKLASAKFGALTAAEQKMLRGAPQRELTWLGPDANPDNPLNDADHAGGWGAERTVRVSLLRWLITDSDAVRYIHPSGLGIAAARIDEPLDLSYLKVPKPVTLVRCYLPGGIDISYAKLQGLELRKSCTNAISGDMAQVTGDLGFTRGTYGAVSLFRAQVGGDLDFSASTISAPGEDAVNAVEMILGGEAVFHRAFTTDGIVDFRLARIGRSLSFNGARFTGDGGSGLNAERATIAGTVYWVEIAHTPHTMLDLENARAASLWDDEASWPAPGNLNVDGFEYESFSGGPIGAPSRLKWLALEAPGYHPQPYRELAKALLDAGREDGATEVQIAKQAARRHFGKLGLLERAWSLLLEVTIGYGYRPLRALWWIAGFVVLGRLLFGWGYRVRIVTPTDEAAYRQFVATGIAPPHYPPFSPFVYSLENFLPVVELHQGEYWRPNPRHGRKRSKGPGDPAAEISIPGRLLRWYLWLHILAGWTLTPLLFAGLSGLVRVD
jgi:hypothetical protein